MPDEMMNTKEVAAYLGIHEKQVYGLIKSKKIPCTRVTGKWVFPKKIIDDWIVKDSRRGMTEARVKSDKIKGSILAAGSNDPILDILLTSMKKDYPEFYFFSSNTGSTDGLKSLKAGYTDLALTHLFDPDSGEYNLPFLPEFTPDMKLVVVNLFYRELGIISNPGNPEKIKSIEDINKKNIKIVNRQKGSGTRNLLDYHLKKLGIDNKNISGYENEVYTHFEIGLSILSGESNFGLATVAIANLLNLHFTPLQKESFDMVLTQEKFFEDGVQAFINTLQTDNFKKKVKPLGKYDFKDSGKIIFS